MASGVEIKGVVPLFGEYGFDRPVDWTIGKGEQWAVVGPNGGGKSLLTDILQGGIARKEGSITVAGTDRSPEPGMIRSIRFRDIYSLIDCSNAYYQQRWNSADREETPFAGKMFEGLPHGKVAEYLRRFGLEHIRGKRIISLSSGELRKALIVRTLAAGPGILILDDPFIGLDAGSRESLNEMLRQMSDMEGLQTILAVADPGEIPEWTDKVLPVKGRHIYTATGLAEFKADKALRRELFPETARVNFELPPSPESAGAAYDTVLAMEEVTVRYGDNVILDNVDWQVAKGEKWALLGENGAGKSTLLSLVNADNPQAYANRIMLFDRRRGRGESIWDIKRRIGYLNSDLHAYYLQNISVSDVVVSGFFASTGLFRKGSDEQCSRAVQWLGAFGASHLADRSFVKLSFGEQRIVLLARTFVKNPEVLILDEPLHGLDAGKKALVKKIIESYCDDPGKTLIYVTHYLHEIPDCVNLTKILHRPK